VSLPARERGPQRAAAGLGLPANSVAADIVMNVARVHAQAPFGDLAATDERPDRGSDLVGAPVGHGNVGGQPDHVE